MTSLNLNNILEETQLSISEADDIKAAKIFRQFKKEGGNIQRTYPALFQKLQSMMTQLKVVAFPNISDEDSCDVLRNHFLEFFVLEAPVEQWMTAKLFFVPFIPRDDLRKQLRKAILENQEKLGEKTIGQWLQEFDQKVDPMKRTPNSIIQFLMNNPSANRLNPKEREILKETLHVYDYLLIVTLPATGPALSRIMSTDWSKADVGAETPMPRSGAYTGQFNKTQSGSIQPGALMPKVQMTLQEALKKFEKLGEQHLSANPIKLKIFDAPVRPSIKNWISDYYEKVDARKHDSIERGNYLFHTENARRLTTGERQKVGTMLRALDEESLVAVDPGRQEIIFENNGDGRNDMGIKGEIGTKREEGVKRVEMGVRGESGGMSFSSGQRFPFEQKSSGPVSPAIRQNPRPSSNVVDLRE